MNEVLNIVKRDILEAHFLIVDFHNLFEIS